MGSQGEGGQFETGNMWSEIAMNTTAGEVGNLRTLLRSAIFFNLSFRLRKCLLIGGTFYVEFVIVLFSVNSQYMFQWRPPTSWQALQRLTMLWRTLSKVPGMF